MIYTDLTRRAAETAYRAHMGQRDKAGMPYIFHPYHLAEQMEDELTVCIALLHDVVEDTDVTFEDLEREFPAEVISALRLLTHAEGEDYFAYVEKIRQDPAAVAVKAADLRHNSDLSRFPAHSPEYGRALERRKKYAAALEILLRE